ncbi:MAG: amidohydrolase [Chitinophagaceae bacterium]|nr:amidohydrolase [Chitinophagaceae bacterium]
MSSLTITLIQPNLIWENKNANLDMLAQKIEGIKEKTEVVILPEMFSTGFSMQPKLLAENMRGETVDWMKKIASSKKIILTGSVIIKDSETSPSERAGGEAYYNRLIWMLPNGEYGVYDKRHLFAFADEHKHYSEGNKRLIAQVKGWKINLQVCYDLRFPVWSRQNPSPNLSPGGEEQASEYDLLVYVANWPEKRSTAWKTLLQARAIENQCYVVGVNRVGEDGNNIHYAGDSMIIDPLGEIIYHKANEEDVFTYTLQKEKLNEVREKFPFWKDADSFIIPE